MAETDTILPIPRLFRSVVAARPDTLCVRHSAGGMTYRELDRRSDALAAAFLARGLSSGDRVGLLCPNGAEFVVSYLGILKAGATAVPLNLLLSPLELSYCLADSGARGLVHHQAFDGAVEHAADGLEPSLRVRIGEGPVPAGVASFADLTDEEELAVDSVHDSELDPVEAVAVILYTSGTTGRPKGAMLTHANLVANARAVASALAMTPEDRVLVVLPMFHAFAATVGMLAPLLIGAALAPVPRFDPRLVTQAIGANGATVFLGVPSMYGVLLRLDDSAVAQWASVRLCVSGGAALPAAVMVAFEERFGIPIVEGDGPTECSPVTCVNPPAGVRKTGSVGLPVPGVEMRILDATGSELPDGVAGEVCVKGPSVMKGYYGLPEATQESFFGQWFRTGDLGTRDSDGYFYLVDRIKDLIIVNGMNVYPRVIEEALYAHPAVAEAAVVGDPDERHGEIPVAYVAFKPGLTAEIEELKAWCRKRLGRHEQPRRFETREALPKTASGKILKRELRRSGERERGVLRQPMDREC